MGSSQTLSTLIFRPDGEALTQMDQGVYDPEGNHFLEEVMLIEGQIRAWEEQIALMEIRRQELIDQALEAGHLSEPAITGGRYVLTVSVKPGRRTIDPDLFKAKFPEAFKEIATPTWKITIADALEQEIPDAEITPCCTMGDDSISKKVKYVPAGKNLRTKKATLDIEGEA